MTKREVGWGVGALVVGLLVGGVLVRHFLRASTTPPVAMPESDAAVPTADASVALADADAAPAPEDASDDLDVSVPPLSLDASAIVDATPDVARRIPPPPGPVPALLERNLLIRAGTSGLCVDAPSRGPGLQLYPCHGKKNQRWTFSEDLNGGSRITGAEGCMRIGPPYTSGGGSLDVGACGSDAPRFRHTEDRRLVDARTGLCVTAHDVVKRAQLVLAPCNPSRGGQVWALTP